MSYEQATADIIQYLQRWADGNYAFIILFLLSLLFLTVASRRKRIMIVLPTVIMTVLIVNPVMYKYVWFRIVDAEKVYWRLLWCIPFVPVIAAAIVEAVQLIRNYIFKTVTLVVLLAVTLYCGNCLYTNYDNYGVRGGNPFHQVDNAYKLEDNVLQIAFAITGESTKQTVMAPAEITTQLRQYDADFDVYQEPTLAAADNHNIQYILNLAASKNATAIVFAKELTADETISLNINGFYYVECAAVSKEGVPYHIYQKTTDASEGTYEVQPYDNQGKGFLLIRDCFGGVCMIDGGQDVAFIQAALEENGNYVKNWILSSLYLDYSFNFYNQLWSAKTAYISAVTGPSVSADLLADKEAEASAAGIQKMVNSYHYFAAIQKSSANHFVQKNENYSADGLQMVNFHGISEDSQLDSIQEASMVFRLGSADNGLLYVGDISAEELDELISEYGEELQTKNICFLTRISNAQELIDLCQPEQVVTLYNLSAEDGTFTISNE